MIKKQVSAELSTGLLQDYHTIFHYVAYYTHDTMQMKLYNTSLHW